MSIQDHNTFNPVVEYRDISGFPGYRIGADGTVWSCWSRGRFAGLTDTWRRLKPVVDPIQGYHRISLCGQGRPKQCSVHVLVLKSFVGPRPPGLNECRHLNGVRSDNRLENLAWGTYSDNHEDMRRHGTLVQGEKHKCSKLTDAAIREIRRLKKEGIVSGRDLADRYGVNPSTICDIAQGNYWKHVT